MSVGPEQVIREDIRALSAYHVQDAQGMIKLDAMENPYRLPAELQRQIGEAVARAPLNRYPDPASTALKDKLRRVIGIAPEYELILGNGSDELIHIIIQCAARPGAAVLAPAPTFAMYGMYSAFCALRYVGVPLNADFTLDLPRFLAAMEEHKPAVVFLSYPNNPTGNLFDETALDQIMERAPGLVVVDEAYGPFASASFIGRLAKYRNLVLLRTLSKLGLAGIRLGYAVARAEWIREFDKVRGPYNVSVLTQVVAETVLDHYEVLEDQARRIRSERARLEAALQRLPGVITYPSHANFVLARVPAAQRVLEGLKARRILIKSFPGQPALEGCLRFTVGTAEENEQLVTALTAELGAL
jgi:histidinol-phosphate aminotransferase